jgi:cytochrome c biogenesis protein CcdA
MRWDWNSFSVGFSTGAITVCLTLWWTGQWHPQHATWWDLVKGIVVLLVLLLISAWCAGHPRKSK